MAMTKKEQSEMKAAIDRAEKLAALRWTAPVERDVEVPQQGYSEGWDYNAFSMSVWQGWSDRIYHGKGKAPVGYKDRNGTQGGRRMYSTKALALAAMRHEMEQKFASHLLSVDRQIATALTSGVTELKKLRDAINEVYPE